MYEYMPIFSKTQDDKTTKTKNRIMVYLNYETTTPQ